MKVLKNLALILLFSIIIFYVEKSLADENASKKSNVNNVSKDNKLQFNTPIGEWKTIDDNTGRTFSIISIYKNGNKLEGKIAKVLEGTEGEKCVSCEGICKDKPLNGLIIMKEFIKDSSNKYIWINGTVLDPENGKTYSSKMTLKDNGTKLEVRGFFVFSWIGRSQTWIRVGTQSEKK